MDTDSQFYAINGLEAQIVGSMRSPEGAPTRAWLMRMKHKLVPGAFPHPFRTSDAAAAAAVALEGMVLQPETNGAGLGMLGFHLEDL
jgi:hypothetical protein